MTDANIEIGIVGRTDGARKIKRSLDDISRSGDKATGEIDQLNRKVKSTTTAANALKSAMRAFIAIFGVREFARVSDQFLLLQARIKNSTENTDEFRIAMGGLLDVSRETGASLQSAVEVFQRLSFTRKEIDATVEEMVTFTGSVQKLGIVSGASTGALNAGLTQLGQALSSDVTRAEEFNSILENIPAVAVAIADELGVTTGQLRQLVINGELLSQDVFSAILNQSQEINDEFEKFPQTIGRAFAQAVLGLKQTVGGFADATGANNLLIEGIVRTGALFETVIRIVQTLILTMRVGFATAVAEITGLFLAMGRTIEDVVNASINAFNKLPGVELGNVNFSSDITTSQLRREIEEEVRADLARLAESGLAAVDASERTFGTAVAGNTGSQTATREITKDYASIVAQLGKTKDETDGLKNSTDALTGTVEDMSREYERVGSVANSVSDTIARGFERAVFQAESFGDSLRSVAQSLASIVFQETAGRALSSAIGGAFSFFGGGSTTPNPTIAGAPIKPRALGGPVTGGDPYLVGERGPELFVPNISGNIVPNNKMGQNTVYNIDARGAEAGVEQRIMMALQKVNSSIETRALSAVQNANRRNPQYLSA